jgi:hypothetical protein
MSLSQRKARNAKANVAAAADDDHAWIRLTQTDGRTVRFHGTLIVEASSYTSSTPVWHVITLYQRDTPASVSYIMSIRTHQKSASIEDTLFVFKLATLEAVMDLLEQYTPENDVHSGITASELKQLAPVEAALHTAKMQCDISQVRRHYAAMVGDFLFKIGSLKLS